MSGFLAVGSVFVALGATAQAVGYLRERARTLAQRRLEAVRRRDHRAIDRELVSARRHWIAWTAVAAGSWMVVGGSVGDL